MSTRLVLLPYVSAGAHTYVSVRSWDRAFRQMVFGTTKPAGPLLKHLRCAQELQHLSQVQPEGVAARRPLVMSRWFFLRRMRTLLTP